MFYKLDKGEGEIDHSLMVESHLYFISICFKQKITAPKVQIYSFVTMITTPDFYLLLVFQVLTEVPQTHHPELLVSILTLFQLG